MSIHYNQYRNEHGLTPKPKMAIEIADSNSLPKFCLPNCILKCLKNGFKNSCQF